MQNKGEGEEKKKKKVRGKYTLKTKIKIIFNSKYSYFDCYVCFILEKIYYPETNTIALF